MERLHEYDINLYVTRNCNLSCEHCYIDLEQRRNDNFISIDNIIKILENSKKFVLYNKFSVLNFGIFGGEIFTLPPKYLNEVINTITEYRNLNYPDVEIKFKAISNFMTKNIDDYLQFLNRLDLIGTSYDIEVKRFNKHNFKLWEDNVKKLRDLNIDVVLNFTITKNILGKEQELFDYTFKELKLSKCHLGYFVPLKNNHTNALKPTHKEHSDFLIKYYDLYKDFKKQGNDILVSPISNMENSLTSDFIDGGCVCEIYNSLNFDTNGDLALCTAVGGNKDFLDRNVGNFFEVEKPEKLLFSTEFKKQYKKANNDFCNDCEFKRVCKSGCGILSEYGLEDGECWGYKNAWEHIKKTNKLS